jgi:hypothetical protein
MQYVRRAASSVRCPCIHLWSPLLVHCWSCRMTADPDVCRDARCRYNTTAEHLRLATVLLPQVFGAPLAAALLAMDGILGLVRPQSHTCGCAAADPPAGCMLHHARFSLVPLPLQWLIVCTRCCPPCLAGRLAVALLGGRPADDSVRAVAALLACRGAGDRPVPAPRGTHLADAA